MNFEIEVVNVNDEENVQTPQMLNSPERQTLVFEDDNANVRITLFANFDSFRIRVCKLLGMQGIRS
jgi:hypothetical protein